MFQNRLTLLAAMLAVLFVSLAVSLPFSGASKSAKLTWPPRPVIVPVEQNVSGGVTVDTSDYFARDPALRRGLPNSVHTILDPSLIDECFDVSVSELAACREASQSASQ